MEHRPANKRTIAESFPRSHDEKVANFENIARRVVDETACVAAEFIARLGSILDPLADPSRVPAVNGIFTFCCRDPEQCNHRSIDFETASAL